MIGNCSEAHRMKCEVDFWISRGYNSKPKLRSLCARLEKKRSPAAVKKISDALSLVIESKKSEALICQAKLL